MIQRFTISFVGVLAVFGLAPPTFADSNCGQFDTGCVSAPIDTFTKKQVENLGGTFFLLEKCGSFGLCDLDKLVGPQGPICSPNLPDEICAALIPTTIPAVSEWGVAVMALLGVITGTLVLMRLRTMLST